MVRILVGKGGFLTTKALDPARHERRYRRRRRQRQRRFTHSLRQPVSPFVKKLNQRLKRGSGT